MKFGRKRKVGMFLAGAMLANSAPHLATAATGRKHLTPLAGKDSSPTVNLVWGLGNLVGGIVMARSCATDHGDTWDRSLNIFEAGVAAVGTWMFVSEFVMGVNTDYSVAKNSTK